MLKVAESLERHARVLRILLPLLSVILPVIILYYLDANSFEFTWKGRTFYMFFIWLIILETILNWEDLRSEKVKLATARIITLAVALLLPTLYILSSKYWGVNDLIYTIAVENAVPAANLMPLSYEYLTLTFLFTVILVFAGGITWLKNYSISIVFLGMIGMIYTIDNLYPYGRFTPFQMFVPTTATLAASILNWMGYSTRMFDVRSSYYGSLSILSASVKTNPAATATFGIAWPCSGIESLLIYTVVILLFLKKSVIPLKQKISYFAVGALVTYFINALRIVTIFIIAINTGIGSDAFWQFHNYYGQLYSITWIISYPLIIIASRHLWGRAIAMRRKSVQPPQSTGSLYVPISS